MVPALAQKCVHYASTMEMMQVNIQRVVGELRGEAYPSQWWRRTLRTNLVKWGLPVQVLQTLPPSVDQP